MTVDVAALTAEQLDLYVAGYVDARDADEQERAMMQRLTDESLTDLARVQRELEAAQADAERLYRIAFSPRPDPRPIVSYQERERQRSEHARTAAVTKLTDWPDAIVQRPGQAT